MSLPINWQSAGYNGLPDSVREDELFMQRLNDILATVPGLAFESDSYGRWSVMTSPYSGHLTLIGGTDLHVILLPDSALSPVIEPLLELADDFSRKLTDGPLFPGWVREPVKEEELLRPDGTPYIVPSAQAPGQNTLTIDIDSDGNKTVNGVPYDEWAANDPQNQANKKILDDLFDGLKNDDDDDEDTEPVSTDRLPGEDDAARDAREIRESADVLTKMLGPIPDENPDAVCGGYRKLPGGFLVRVDRKGANHIKYSGFDPSIVHDQSFMDMVRDVIVAAGHEDRIVFDNVSPYGPEDEEDYEGEEDGYPYWAIRDLQGDDWMTIVNDDVETTHWESNTPLGDVVEALIPVLDAYVKDSFGGKQGFLDDQDEALVAYVQGGGVI